MTKDDTIRYAIDHMMDEGFFNSKCSSVVSEARRILIEQYDIIAGRGDRVSPTRLANHVIELLNKRREDTNKSKNNKSHGNHKPNRKR